ncbi:hypothetical protein, partial [Kaarinaea lacus]
MSTVIEKVAPPRQSGENQLDHQPSQELSHDDLVNLLNELIGKKLSSLCKTYCYTNRYQYICT